jgi:WD40 repeat protein
VATGSNDNNAMIWDAVSGDKVKTLTGHSNNVDAVAYSPDGKYVISGSNDNTIIIWDAKTGSKTNTLSGHSGKMSVLAFIPGSTILTSGDSTMVDGGARGPFGIPILSEKACKLIFWNIDTAKQLKALDSDCDLSSMAYSPNGKYLVTGHNGSSSFMTIYETK